MSKEMRKYIDTFKQKLTESENLNISDVSRSFSEQELIDFVDWVNTNYIQGKQGGYDWVEFDGETFHTTKSLLYKYLEN